MDQNSISYQEVFNAFNNPAITKPFNGVKSMTNLAYIWIRSLSWLILSCFPYLWQKDLGKKSWEMGHSLVFWWSQKVKDGKYCSFLLSLHSGCKPKAKTRPLEWHQVCSVFYSSKMLFVMWVCFNALCLKACVLFDALYAVDIALCGLQNSSEPMF